MLLFFGGGVEGKILNVSGNIPNKCFFNGQHLDTYNRHARQQEAYQHDYWLLNRNVASIQTSGLGFLDVLVVRAFNQVI